jgi:hypothetical protein
MDLKMLKDAFERRSVFYSSEVRRLKEIENQQIADVTANKGFMPNNYWLPRQRAEARLFACMLLTEALDEAVKTELSEREKRRGIRRANPAPFGGPPMEHR